MICKLTKIVLLFLIMETLTVFMILSGYMIYTVNSGYGDWFDTTIGGLLILISVIFSPVPFMIAHYEWQDWKNYKI